MGHHAVGVLGQVQQQVELLGSELEFASGDGDRAGSQVDAEIAGFDHLRRYFRLGGAPEIGPHTGKKFIHAERLGDVVVSTGVQRLDLLAFLVTHREDDDRYLRHGAHSAAQLHAVQVGHGEVGDDQVGRPVLHDFQRHLAVVGHADLIALRY